jgi:hypothetical protein
MGILDAFKQDCIDNPNVTNGDSALQEEIKKQMKAIADHDANPEILDSKIKFNPEEFDFNEKKISKELYVEEDNQYPDADDPEELLKETVSNNLSSNTDNIIDLNDVNNFFNLTKCECNEVKVGDKLKIYNRKTQTFDTVEVFSINKCYHPFTFEPVVAVTVNYDYDGVAEHDLHGLRKLSDPNLYYKLGSNEPIKEFTIKN